MQSAIYWLDGPWRGKLGLAARPRGGDWISDEMAKWKRAGVGAVLSLLTPEEERDLDLVQEASVATSQKMKFWSLPIPDRQVPKSEAKLAESLDEVFSALSAGGNVLVHCRQGVGRTGLVAACLLVKSGMSPGAAVENVSAARGVPVPETPEQRDWIDHYATALAK